MKPLRYSLIALSLLLHIAACVPLDPNEKFIQGTWTSAGDLGDGHSWYLEWTFANGRFEVNGYPPLHHSGKYRLVTSLGSNLSIKLYDQQGDLPTGSRTVDIVIDTANKTLMIDGRGPFSLAPP